MREVTRRRHPEIKIFEEDFDRGEYQQVFSVAYAENEKTVSIGTEVYHPQWNHAYGRSITLKKEDLEKLKAIFQYAIDCLEAIED